MPNGKIFFKSKRGAKYQVYNEGGIWHSDVQETPTDKVWVKWVSKNTFAELMWAIQSLEEMTV